jgi:Tfp pilus assembly protein PilO
MRTAHANRLWMIIGVLVAALLTAGTYVLGVKPMSDETDDLVAQTDSAQQQTIVLRRRISELKEAKKNEGKLKATRDSYRDALPSGSGVPAFLRQMQASGTDVDVDVSGLAVGAPEAVKDVAGVWSLQIQLTAEGTAGHLDAFLRQLQGSSQKRAVLIETASLGAGEGENPDDMRLSLSVKAFVAPPVGSGAPTVTTD